MDELHAELSKGFEPLHNDPEYIHIGLQLEALSQVQGAMKRKGITQSELARRMGCSRQNISQLFRDEANFKLEMVAKLAAALEMKITLRLMEQLEYVEVRQTTKRVVEETIPKIQSAKAESISEEPTTKKRSKKSTAPSSKRAQTTGLNTK